MVKTHFLIFGKLGWRFELTNVVMDDYTSGRATVNKWDSMPTGQAFAVARIFARARQLITINSWLGDDHYAQLVLNRLDRMNINTELIKLIPNARTLIECYINKQRPDSLHIQAPVTIERSYSLAMPTSAPDWFVITTDCTNLYQINEILHQAFLRHAQAALMISTVSADDFSRFSYLLEDVNMLVLTATVAKQFTEQADIKQAALRLVKLVDRVAVLDDRQLIVADRQVMLELVATVTLPIDLDSLGTGLLLGIRKYPGDLAEAFKVTWQTLGLHRAVAAEAVTVREQPL